MSFQWVLDQGKFLSQEELIRLKTLADKRKEKAKRKKQTTAIRDWFVINLGLYTGLRVKEMSMLLIRDFTVDDENSSLFVRHGKKGKQRFVKFGKKFRKILTEYLEWKKNIKEPLSENSYLIYSSISKGMMSKRGIQEIFERTAKKAGINGHSIHHLRHTFASHLYKASGYNLRLVQKQLGHSSIQITEVYADVLRPDLDKAVNGLYGDI